MVELKSLEYLRNIEATIMTSRRFGGFAIVRVNKVFDDIDRMYANLPVDVLEARKTDKSFEINPNTYDDLKKLEMCLYDGFPLLGIGTIVKLSEVGSLIHNIYDDLGAID